MAGGKLSARQKMINLMYLVFIAMMALNMSKEVLSAFGSINEKLDKSNASYEAKNKKAYDGLVLKASESPEFKAAATTAKSASELSESYFAYLKNEKELLLGDYEVKTNYESMDKTQFLDERYYAGGQLTPDGQKFIAEMDKYRDGMVALIGETNQDLANQIKADFSTADIEDGEGIKKDYINYHFVGFPAVSSLTKLTSIQNDIKSVENELLSKLLSGNLKELASLDNYETVMTMEKGAYYSSDTFNGQISLGRVDASTQPSRVDLKIDGRTLNENQYSFDGGKLVLKVGAGGVGEHKITGSLFYPQDGKEIEVPVKQQFTTIAKPNSATIAADKMNVVYRGVSNPMTIDFAGIDPSKVNAKAAGLSKKSGTSYTMTPGSGREVTISVNATLPNGGGPVSDKATFRIKDIPRPTGTIRGEDGNGGCVKMQRQGLEKSSIGAALQDFDFDLKLDVTGFSFKVSGQPTIKVSGRKLNGAATSALRKAKRGETVQIYDINARISGNSGYKLKKISPICVELAN
ncbi:hypothetical protein SCB49_02604 [unidentified eubacterium SCB49]|nr:hypothetical protein SCB49_02604 [unidentified eubacterium SCB49]